MKVEKFKVLLYLKKSGLDKSGKAPIMGRITVNRTMAQFGCKLSCTPELWNPRESRLNGKSKEAVETNAKIEKLLLAINSAFDSLLERKQEFDATAVKDMFQGSMDKQMTLLKQFDRINEDLKSRIGIDRAEGTYSKYYYTRQILAGFIRERFKTEDVAFGQLYERFIWDFQDYVLDEKKQSLQSVRHYLALLKKVCRIAYKEGHSERYFFCNFKLPKQEISAPKALTREEFVKVRDVEISVRRRPSLALTRDLFLFALFTGLAYSDVKNLTTDRLQTFFDGNLWIITRRKKTNTESNIRLLDVPKRIIEKYKGLARDGHVFPVPSNGNCNKILKDIGRQCGFKVRLTYHVARHIISSYSLKTKNLQRFSA